MVKTACLTCKKNFKYDPWNNKGKYCSYKCYWYSKKGIYPKQLRVVKKPFFCIDCNKEFNHYARSTKRCSSCWFLYKKNHREEHYNWKGGITPINKLERYKFIYTLRDLIFQKDNYTCRICKNRGGNLHINHIKSWAKYPLLRFNINNCETLCKSCHYLITFGRIMDKNTKWSDYWKGGE